MKTPQLGECCCGCSLRVGTLIIGWICMVPSLLMLGLSSILLIKNEFVDEPQNYNINDSPMQIYKPAILSLAYTSLLISSLLSTLVTLLLLVGVYKEKPKLVLSWIIIVIVLQTLRFLTLGATLFGTPDPKTMAIEAFGLVLFIYCLLVVYSYYRETRDAAKAGPPYTNSI